MRKNWCYYWFSKRNVIATGEFDKLWSNLVWDEKTFIEFVSEVLKENSRWKELQAILYTNLTYLVVSYAEKWDLDWLKKYYRIIVAQLSGWERIHLFNFVRMINFLENQEYNGISPLLIK